MRRIGYRLAAALISMGLLAAADEPPAPLRRGINITHWFRYPPSRDPAALRNYVSDKVLEDLRRVGFTFIRLPVQPDLLASPAALVDAIARVQRHGLAVMVALFADGWHLESDSGDRAKLIATWRALAVALRPLDPRLTFPEVLNEPVFPDDPGSWALLQQQVVRAIRAKLPRDTIVLTGANWSSVAGLLSLSPEPDPQVIYSFHFYEPPELTSLGAYRPGLDMAAMAKLPFPARDEAGWAGVAETTADRPTAELIRFYCAQHWDRDAVAAHIGVAGAWARKNHVAVIAGEFGASERLNPMARMQWLRTVRTACEEQGFGWALWGYDDSMGLGMTSPAHRDGISPEIGSALGLALAK
ncbi:MAG TPA: cellulase family glycosylhydrolase [Acetobacteraceae bacterium]|nr:cellulase family glycosylhydrolase [Acetobacteraceae bacterium]